MNLKRIISLILILCVALPSFGTNAEDTTEFIKMIYRTDFSEFTENYPDGVDITNITAGSTRELAAAYPEVDSNSWNFLFWWQFLKGGTGGFYKESSGKSYMHLNGYNANGDYIRFKPLGKNPANVNGKLVISEKISYHTSARPLDFTNYWPAGTLMSYATGTAGIGGALILVRRTDNMLFAWKTSGQSQIAKDKSNIIELGCKIGTTPVELASVIDIENNSYDIYVNGECKASGIKSVTFTGAPFRNFDLYSSGLANAKMYGFSVYDSDGYKSPETYGGYKYHKYDDETREFAVYNADYSYNGSAADFSCEIYNNTSEEKNISILAAVYKDKSLKDVYKIPVSLAPYEIYPFENTVFYTDSDTFGVRYFFMENTENIKPLGKDILMYHANQELKVLKYVDFEKVDINNPLEYTLKFRIYNKDNEFKVVEKDGRNWWNLTQSLSNDPHIDIKLGIKTPDKLYQEIEFIRRSSKNEVRLLHIQDNLGVSNDLITLGEDGGLYTANGEKISVAEKDTLISLICEVDFSNKCYNVYKNGEKIASNIGLENSVSNYLEKWRIYMYRGAEAVLDIGKIAAYTANMVTNLENEFGDELTKREYRFFTDEYAINQAKEGSVAFSTYSNYAVINGERVKNTVKPVILDGIYYVPFEIINKAYSASSVGEQITVNGAEISGKTINGTLYAAISELSNALNLNCFVDNEGNEQGFGIIGNHSFKDFKENSYNYREINNYLIFERPKEDEISERFTATSAGQHPRIYAGKDRIDSFFEQSETVEWKKKYLSSLLIEAEGYVNSDDLSLVCSDGVRLDASSYIEQRVKILSIAHLYSKKSVDYDNRFLNKILSYIESLGELSDWNPSHFLDTAAVTNAFAIVYDQLFDDLTQDEKSYIAEKIVNNGLKYSEASYMGDWEIDVDWGKPIGENDVPLGNWAIVCQTGMLNGALAVMDIPQYQALAGKVIETALRQLEYSLIGFAPDGAWDEGAAYWEFANKYLSAMMESMKLSFGTTFGYLDYEPLKTTGDFIVAMSCATSGFAFGDGETGLVNSMALPWFAYAFENENYQRYLLRKIENNRKTVNLNDALYLDGTMDSSENISFLEDMYFNSIETGVMSSGLMDTESTCVGYHCGTNMAGHMNYDSGTFVFDSMGVRWIDDTGKDNYNIPGYGGKTVNNEEIAYASRTEGNNCYVLNPSYHSGQEKETYGQKIIKKAESDSEAFVVMDITASYKKDATSALRGFKLTDDRNSLIIRDEIKLKKASEFYSFMHTTKNVEVDSSNSNIAYFTDVSGKKLKAELVSNQPVSFKVMEAKRLETSPPEHELQKYFGNYKKLAICGTVSGNANITVKLTPVIEGMEFSSAETLALSQWTVSNEDLPEREEMYLDDITVNGHSLSLFNRYQTGYAYLAGSNQEFAGVTDNENIIVSTAKNGNLYQIVLKQKNRLSNFKVYTVDVREIPIRAEDGIPSGTQLINPVKISASNFGNSANVFDGSFETYWNGTDAGVYLIYEFDKVYDISAIDTGVLQSYRRRQYIDLYASEDGITYFPVIEGGRTTAPGKGYQRFSFSPVKAKYVKLVCNNYEDTLNNYSIIKYWRNNSFNSNKH